MSAKSLDKLLYLSTILKKKAGEPSELLEPSFEEELDPGIEPDHKFVPLEDDFNLGHLDDLSIHIRDFVGDLIESGAPLSAIKKEFEDALSRFEMKGKWNGDVLEAKKNVVDLLKLANYITKSK